jgi:predicted nucleic acid-binding protein
VIYFDTCALIKLIRADGDSPALGAFIDSRPGTRWLSSELARAELARAVRRVNHDTHGAVLDEKKLRAELGYVDRLWERLDLVPVSTRVLADAAAFEQPFLRTLDAIHLAAAASARASLSAFVTYDKKLAQAARDARLPVLSPR